MSRLGGAFWFTLVIAAVTTNFLVKQTVQNLDDQLAQVKRKTVEDQKKIHDLTADWTFLNQPELLADLNNRYVHLVPMSPRQVVANLDGIPMRPVAPPEDAAPLPVAEAAAAAPLSAPVPLDATAPTDLAAASPPTQVHTPAATLSLISTAHAATVPAAPRPARSPAAPVQPASLDAIFAQVAGSR
ncbi:MAG TPA: hypothetical protein VME45_05575 [Stellaceae bacterium]|nr:hypothetical protein [Stellaceae bacterium]